MPEKESSGVIAGVDEAGRGCLCYDVVVAAVILPSEHRIHGLADSKTLSSKKREYLYQQIKQVALDYAIVSIPAQVIDQINILQASLQGMAQVLTQLQHPFDLALVDGNKTPACHKPVKAVIKGDKTIAAISAASILAKVTRDRAMLKLHEQYPEYGFDRHKGYPTRLHLQKLQQLPILDFYRKSYAPVKRLLS